MTTIAYNHKDKEIAYDSRQTMGNCIITDFAEKKIETDKGIFFLAGPVSQCQFVANNYPDKKEGTDICGLAVINGDLYWIGTTDYGLSSTIVECDMTAGSGEAYAQAAMDFGKSAEEAVRYAMQRDNCTGGMVQVFKVK
jgi:ATP-dependent protease HslVU (ClpYQ) peptidase subunit